ncbi:leucine-rich repeat domain-containing protein, partial [uncultured Kordia sp.]|uniref:leucine-rich repeat domain-containing protein n=1 Tax=uncultured Kordia sp. TaxID=507699 RepID=UPI00260F07F5
QDIQALSKLTSLTWLHLSDNKIQDIQVLSNLTLLTSLYLYDNKIQDIQGLSKLTSLTTLSLFFNQIQDIQALSKLTSLTWLHLSDNKIQDIRVLSKLTSLTALYLRSNQIQGIQALSELTSLTSLYLSDNKIQDIQGLSKLTSLTTLSLFSNQIQDIQALSKLTSLNELRLSSNQIQDIQVLSKLTSLIDLYLSDNKIQDISSIVNLTSLRYLNLKNNPIKNVKEDILQGSAQEVVRRLQEQQKSQKNEEKELLIKDVKILLLGNTNIGKSNLLDFWKQWHTAKEITKAYPEDSDSTHGLVYEEFEEQDIMPRLHIWDFGGQEYFHATHQLFFSAGALHVLLWSKMPPETRKENEEVFELDYWLRCAEQLSKGKNAIEMVLVETHIDHADKDKSVEFYSHFPTASYLNKFNIYSPHEEKDNDKPSFMLNACSVSLLYQKRLQGMFELLEERIDMLYQKNTYPPIYTKIRDALVASNEAIWTLEAYKEEFSEKDGVILQTLHRAGCLLYFHKHLPEKIFLKPEVLLELIYDKILNPNLKNKNGKITNELTKAAKNNKLQLSAQELETLLSAFKLIFKTKEGDWFAPQYLPEESPVWLQLLKEYTFGIANIIVSTDHYLMNSILLDIFSEYAGVIKKDDSYMFWQKGLVIEKDGQLLLIEYDRKQMRLLLYGDQQEKNKQLQKDVVDFILNTIKEADGSLYDQDNLVAVEDTESRVISKRMEGKQYRPKNANWNSTKIKIGVSVDGKYYVHVQQLNDNVANGIYTIKAFDYDDSSIQKTFSVFQFNQYLDNQHKGILKKVAISYSKDDLKLVNEFIKNLVPLHDDGLIENPWYCSQLEAGTEWNKEIQEKFNQADIIFFMVSPNFLATKYIKEHEIKTAIARRQQEIEDNVMPSKQVKIIPIILDFCRWQRKDAKYNLGTYTALPYTAKPVMDFKNRNMAWYIIEEAIRVAIEKDNDPEFDSTLSKEVKKIYERIMDRRVDDDNDTSK